MWWHTHYLESRRYDLDYSALAVSQETEEQMRKHQRSESSLRLRKIDLPGAGVAVFCDTVEATPRPFLTKVFRRAAIDNIHNLANSGINTTVRLSDMFGR